MELLVDDAEGVVVEVELLGVAASSSANGTVGSVSMNLSKR